MALPSKEKNFSKWYNKLVFESELIDNRYNVQGFFVHRPWSMLSIRELYRLFEHELEKCGHLPALFPTVIPEENFKKEKEHVEGFAPEVFWITMAGSEKLERRLALRPTSETAMYQMYSLWLRSYNDLPLKIYQSCNIFRNEKETNAFLRGCEFLWIESHDVFENEEGAVAQTREDMKIMEAVMTEKLGVPMLLFQRPQWDKFAGAVESFAYDTLLPDGKVNQIGTTHLLGQNFSRAFGVKFKDKNGNDEYAHQTCFGIGIWRMIGMIIAIHGDDRGVVFPFEIAPVQVVIVPILGTKNDEKITAMGREIENRLKKAKIRTKIDLSEKTPGFKFNEWEMKGVPIRIEIGEKELKEKTLTLSRRDTKNRIVTKENELLKEIKKIADDILKNISKKAERDLNAHIGEAKTKEEVKKLLDEKGGFVRVNFCSMKMDGKECADILKDYTKGGKVRGLLLKKEEKQKGKCVICGKPTSIVTYVARQY